MSPVHGERLLFELNLFDFKCQSILLKMIAIQFAELIKGQGREIVD